MNWSYTWGMEFNASKCKVLRVARIKSVFDRDYFLGGIRLDRVIIEKDLGVLIRHDLSWNDHVDFITGKAQNLLKRLFHISDVKTKQLLYITWVRSRLEYATVVWSPYTKRNISRLERIQRRATRFILDIFDYVSFRSCGKSLRNVDHLTLNIPFSRTESFRNSYFVRICRLWNDLPLVIRESDTSAIFRNKLLVSLS